MFPLGSVLFPHTGIPLHIFEPRYRLMVDHLLAADRPDFGITLIERGSEVGGGDRRFSIGTIARVAEAEQLEDGRWLLGCVGIERLRVHEWLPDAPYPAAIVERWSDDPTSADGATIGSEELLKRIDGVVARLRRVLALAAEAGMSTAPATVELDIDPMVRLWQAAAITPVGPLDDLKVLSSRSPEERVAVVSELIADAELLLTNRLSGD
jgi:uncharacterized protein